MGTNGRNSKSAGKGPNSDVFPSDHGFFNVASSSTKNVDSDSEVEDVVDDHAVFMASTGLKRGDDSGYGTNSLLEQWRSTKRDDDYDPYDDDLYESHDMSENLQAICDD
ncbi:hypothetical protein Tco_0311233, partial [Tanacetum coccineum]